MPLALSIFADRAHLRSEIRDDAEAAGFRVAEAGDFAALLEGEARVLGEVVLLDCPEVDGPRWRRLPGSTCARRIAVRNRSFRPP